MSNELGGSGVPDRPMTLADIRKLAEQALEDDKRATPGPWHADSLHAGLRYLRKNIEWYPDDAMPTGHDVPYERDAESIAAARTREPQLAAFALAVLETLDAASADFDDEEAQEIAGRFKRAIARRLKP